MHIIDNPEKFASAINKPNPQEIYGLVPLGFKVLSLAPINHHFAENTNTLLYGDVKIIGPNIELIKYNPSFDIFVFMNKMPLDSPIFVRTEKPLQCKPSNLNEMAHELMAQILGIHIPEPIFQWNQ